MRLIFSLLVLFFCCVEVQAANVPCSGRKGGISHCRGAIFICNDGSVSASKKHCENTMVGTTRGFISNGISGNAGRGGSNTPRAAFSNSCSCRLGVYCTGPRGGRYCYTDRGSKSYLRR